MRLLSLHINGFGKFKNKDLVFGDNMNIVYGYNEAGKSTIFMFIKAMLYGLERAKGRASKSDTWTKFKPGETAISMAEGFASHTAKEHIVSKETLQKRLQPPLPLSMKPTANRLKVQPNF